MAWISFLKAKEPTRKEKGERFQGLFLLVQTKVSMAMTAVGGSKHGYPREHPNGSPFKSAKQ